MRRIIVGTFSIMLGTFLLMDSLPGITGYVISGKETLNSLSLFGFIFLICGFTLFILEMRKKGKVIKAERHRKK